MKISIQLEKGDTIKTVVETVSKISKATYTTISFFFNDFQVIVGPNHDPTVVINDNIKRATTLKEDD